MNPLTGRFAFLVVGLAGLGMAARGQGTAACSAAAAQPSGPAATAFAEGRTGDAETLYTQALGQQPGDPVLTAGLMRTLLREGKVSQAAAAATAEHAGESHSAALLTAVAEMQLREGQPWEARRTLESAASADACYPRAYLIRSRVDRLDSMYASERSEIQRAYELDPADPDIKHAWNSVDSPAKDVAGTVEYLATDQKIDPAARKAAEESVASMMPLFSETSQNCRELPTVTTATLPLQPMMRDGRHVDGYRLDVQLGQSKAKLVVDTAASGLYLSRALATENGYQAGEGDPPGTVRAPVVTIGPMEFHDCLVGVNEAPFADKGDGFVGTDLFSASLITLDQPHGKLVLEPLPKEPGPLPMDRSVAESMAPELRGWEPVYHKAQYVLVPVALNHRERSLFVLDTGIRFSTIMPEVANLASANQKSATSPMQTTSGVTLQVYRSGFDFEFASLMLRRQEHILALDSSPMEQKLGMELGGLLGFDLLHSMVIHLDYRDGLAKFESTEAEVAEPGSPVQVATNSAPGKPAEEASCPPLPGGSLTTNATIEARTTGLWESNHLKAGQSVTVAVGVPWNSPVCSLATGAVLYGHVTAAVSPKSGTGQLGLEFDHADCLGKGRKELGLKIVSLMGPPGQVNGLHNAVPITIGGGLGRQIGDAVAAAGPTGTDPNLNDTGTPRSVQPGSVVGLPKLALDVSGGPGCSALLNSTERSFRLGTGTAFLLVVTQTGP